MMEKKNVILIGVILLLFPVFLISFYFLYPKLNPERYDEIRNQQQAEQPFAFNTLSNENEQLRTINYSDLANQLEEYMQRELQYNDQIDSLSIINDSLQNQLTVLKDSLSHLAEWERKDSQEQLSDDPLTSRSSDQASAEQVSLFADEEFSERVKSLLNLDEEELGPIVKNMDNHQLLQLYRGGGSIQREKLLRALSPERAAKLMQEVML